MIAWHKLGSLTPLLGLLSIPARRSLRRPSPWHELLPLFLERAQLILFSASVVRERGGKSPPLMPHLYSGQSTVPRTGLFVGCESARVHGQGDASFWVPSSLGLNTRKPENSFVTSLVSPSSTHPGHFFLVRVTHPLISAFPSPYIFLIRREESSLPGLAS